jgi:hypothetical protein
MKRILGLVVCLCAAPALRADELAPGRWQLTFLAPTGVNASTFWVLKVDNTDGKSTATVAAAMPAFKASQVKTFTVKGDVVHVVLSGPQEIVFDGRLAKDGKKVLGTIGTPDPFSPAWLEPTELTELTPANMNKPAGAAGAGLVALSKLRGAKKDAAPGDLEEWAATVNKDAAQYGRAWQGVANAAIATALAKHPTQGALALKYAEAAQKTLDPKASPTHQIQLLETLALAAQRASKGEVSDAALVKVAKLDQVLDKEYVAEGLPFKPAAFTGRKGDSKRVAVLELFTGAQCPPCVAADLAFDGLLKTYKPSDVALIQYHVHIPGPDPLTNSDTEARWKHYQGAFPGKVGGVPTAVINGKTPRVGGGARQGAGMTYNTYRDMLEPILETPAGCGLTARAVRNGDRIDIEANVADLNEPGTDKKLRLVLVEEVVHYGGGNKIRMHHHVVRAMPGGTDGKAIMEKNTQVKATVELPELRKTLTSYLDNFVANKGPFPRQIRPMEMHDLRVIALVQDDQTHEILQATVVNVSAP